MATFTAVHVLISLVGIASGLVVLAGLLTSKRLDGWTALFLATTAATSVTGFGFPAERILPSHIVGVISLIVLGVALYARYPRRLEGRWRAIYIVTAGIALYLNVFVGIVQAFLKVPPLTALAPTQSEAPFVAAQLAALASFVILVILALSRFRVDERHSQSATGVPVSEL